MRLTACSVFLCVLLGCQAPAPVTVTQNEAVQAAPATAEVWGEVPKQCA